MPNLVFYFSKMLAKSAWPLIHLARSLTTQSGPPSLARPEAFHHVPAPASVVLLFRFGPLHKCFARKSSHRIGSLAILPLAFAFGFQQSLESPTPLPLLSTVAQFHLLVRPAAAETLASKSLQMRI